jgi:glycosyltransferase involved in cell wall biosynthesis
MATVEQRVDQPRPAGVVAEPVAPAPRRQIACISSAPWNPYLRLLYTHLAAHGFELVERPRFSLRWLWGSRRQVGFLHFHWPEGLYRFERGPSSLRGALSWVKVGAVAARLGAARLLRYRLIWTIHQVSPHETRSAWRDRLGVLVLSRACQTLLVHDRATRDDAVEVLGLDPGRLDVVPHGSYIGVYPPGRERSEVRAELGLPANAFVFLAFGELRRYKGIELLLEAFSAASLERTALLVVGNPKDPAVAEAIREAAAADARITPLFGFLPEDAVAELYGAADASVLARSDGGTSGSLILSLSLGVPAVAADLPVYRELTENGAAGWLFRPGDAGSLGRALESAAADPADARARGRRAYALAEQLAWPEIATRAAGAILRRR